MAGDLLTGEVRPLIKRQINEASCAKWGYRVAEFNGKTVQVADYYDTTGTILVAQKVRFPNKDFLILGDMKQAGLYGQQLWRDKGKKIVITEGEIDAISMSQIQDHKWPVVSVNNGAAGAKKSIARNLEFLTGFEEVILMFDNDDEGRKAAATCAEILPPGRAKIATLPLKDASDMLVAGRAKELIDAMWGAKTYRPDGLVTLAEVKEAVLMAPEQGLPWQLPKLNDLTFGRRLGECYAVGAGTGVGKTDFMLQQIAYDLTVVNEPVGLFFLEQQPVETIKRLAGKHARKRFHIPSDVAGWKQEELVDALNTLEGSAKLYLYDHFGSADWETVRSRIRYLALHEGVKLFYLDHLTALAAEEDDERRALEKIMAQMGKLVKELRIILTFVSHLATPDGKPHEEGGRVMVRHFKGSRAIGFWSHYMFGLERNQQADDPEEQKLTTFRVLKDRYAGDANGKTFTLTYDATTGMLGETDGISFAPEPENGDAF